MTACLAHFDFQDFDIDKSIEEINSLLDFPHLMDISSWETKVELAPTFISAPVTCPVGFLLELDLQPSQPIVPFVDVVDTITIDQGKADYIQNWEVGGPCIEVHCPKGQLENDKVGCSVFIPRVTFVILPFKHTFPWYDDFICMVTRGTILNRLRDQLLAILVVESNDTFWNDPSLRNYKKRLKVVRSLLCNG